MTKFTKSQPPGLRDLLCSLIEVDDDGNEDDLDVLYDDTNDDEG